MKVWSKTLVAMFATAVLLSACKKEETAAPEAETTATAPAETTAPAAPAAPAADPAASTSSGPGGYVPTPEERYVPDGAAAAPSAEATPPATDPARANEEKEKAAQ